VHLFRKSTRPAQGLKVFNGGKKLYRIGIHSNVKSNADFTDGHVWLSSEKSGTNGMGTYGLWNNNSGVFGVLSSGLGNGVILNKEGAYRPQASKFFLIDRVQYNTFQNYINTPDTWYITNTCAEWARDAIYATTGNYLDVDDNFGIETPRELSRTLGK